MAWNLTWWCILTTFRTDKIMVMICWFSYVWRHFDLVKQVKFGVSGHFPENAWREWPAILHADVSRLPSELISLWSRSVDFLILALFDLVRQDKFGVSGYFPENAWREWPEFLLADVSWQLSELIRLWSQSVDFISFHATLTWNRYNLGFQGIYPEKAWRE